MKILRVFFVLVFLAGLGQTVSASPVNVTYDEYCAPILQDKDDQPHDIRSNPAQDIVDENGNSGTLVFDSVTNTYLLKNGCSSKGDLTVGIMGKPFTAAPCKEKEIHFVSVNPEDQAGAEASTHDVLDGPDRLKALRDAGALPFLAAIPSGSGAVDLGDGKKLDVVYDATTYFLTIKNTCESSGPATVRVLDFSFTINPCEEKYIYLSAYPCKYMPTAAEGNEIPEVGKDGVEDPEELREPTSEI